MARNPLISIIIPFGNAAKTLPRCLESVGSQTMRDIELVLVDANSKDDSRRIAEDFASGSTIGTIILESDRCCRANAKNMALSHASGDYYAFVDTNADIADTMLEKMYDSALSNASDLVECGVSIADPATELVSEFTTPSYDVLEGKLAECPAKLEEIELTLTGKLIRSSLVKENVLKFGEGLVRAEDYLFTCLLLLHSSKATSVHEVLYHGQLSNTKRRPSIPNFEMESCLLRASQIVIDEYRACGCFEEARKYLLKDLVRRFIGKHPSYFTIDDPWLEPFKNELFEVLDTHFKEEWKQAVVAEVGRLKGAKIIRNLERV